MPTKKLIVVFAFFISLQAIATGGIVGNGGDIIYCPANNYPFSLDYLIARAHFKRKFSPLSVASIEASMARLQKIIDEKFPEHRHSFAEYTASIFKNRTSSEFRWIPSENLVDLQDEGEIRIPAGCRGSGYGPMTMVQGAIRVISKEISPSKKLIKIFHFNEVSVADLQPIQLSFFLMHEWLWELNLSPHQMRLFNYIMHSNLAEDLKPEAIKKMAEISTE